VGIGNSLPLRLGTDEAAVSAVGKPVPPGRQSSLATIYAVTPGYLAAAGTRLVAGRDIDWRDRAGAQPVAVVNRTFARTLFPGENAIGQRFRIGRDPRAEQIEIAGEVEDGKYQPLGEDPVLAAFRPMAQGYNHWTTVVMRTSLPAGQATGSLRRPIAEMDPALALYNTGSSRDQLVYPLFPARAAAVVLGAFGFIAVVLAATGVFALVAYSVARRTSEIGIRMALGADARQVPGVLSLVGAGAGAAIAPVAGRSLPAVLYGVSPNDPRTYGIAVVPMAAICGLPCWLPAMRALGIDPSRALREG
jgi:hypothetical protein